MVAGGTLRPERIPFYFTLLVIHSAFSLQHSSTTLRALMETLALRALLETLRALWETTGPF